MRGGWRQWVAFRTARGESPWLEGRDREERTRNEDDLITYSVFLARVMGRTDGTVKQKLFAVRYAHLALGYGDPLLHRARLWATLAGLHRWQGPRQRKKPVTPRMLVWLKKFVVKETSPCQS